MVDWNSQQRIHRTEAENTGINTQLRSKSVVWQTPAADTSLRQPSPAPATSHFPAFLPKASHRTRYISTSTTTASRVEVLPCTHREPDPLDRHRAHRTVQHSTAEYNRSADMAPPPPASLPLQQRLIHLAQTLQFAWFVGHLSLLFCIVRYGLSYMTFNYYSRWAKFSYRTAFVSAAVTYGIVVYKAFRARSRASSRAQGSPLALAADENVQYLAMALVWLFSPQYPLAMLPFGVYSIFHVATYTRTNLIPTIQPSQPVAPAAGASPNAKPTLKANPTADMIGRFVKEYYDTSMGLVAILEILLWGRLFLSALTFAKGSWILIAIYTTFLRARYAQSSFVQFQFRQLEARIDSLVGGQSVPPAARQAWGTVKGGARTFHDATDVGKYVGGPAPKKTT